VAPSILRGTRTKSPHSHLQEVARSGARSLSCGGTRRQRKLATGHRMKRRGGSSRAKRHHVRDAPSQTFRTGHCTQRAHRSLHFFVVDHLSPQSIMGATENMRVRVFGFMEHRNSINANAAAAGGPARPQPARHRGSTKALPTPPRPSQRPAKAAGA